MKSFKSLVTAFYEKRILVLVFVFAVGFAVPTGYRISSANADSISELQQKAQQLQDSIDANNAIVKELEEQEDSLEAKVGQLQAEVDAANDEIELTEVNLDQLRQRLAEAEEKLEQQKDLLKATLQAIYERSGVSTFELLMATDSFTDFLNEQEYLSQLQDAVKQSTQEVIKLRQQIEDEKIKQEELLEKQKQQKAVAVAKKQEQEDLLESTRGQEAAYRDLVSSQLAALEEAEAELAALLAAGSYVNYGPVARGEVIGSLGSTGFSTGPHIHFQVYKNGSTTNPSTGGTSLINGYAWPLFGGVGWISQSYGCVAPYWVYAQKCNGGTNSFHTGLDIAASAYTPVVAADAGDVIFKGCSSGLGYVVVIDHGGGWQTWYPHMVTPQGQVYGYC